MCMVTEDQFAVLNKTVHIPLTLLICKSKHSVHKRMIAILYLGNSIDVIARTKVRIFNKIIRYLIRF